MKKDTILKIISIVLALCLMLSSCNGNDLISGEVVEATPAALILETGDGKRVAVLMEEDTCVSGMEGLDGEAYKANPHTGVKVRFSPEGRAGSVTASDGTEVSAYRPDIMIWIWAYLVPEAAVLSDGTVLDAWKTDPFIHSTYQTREGVELLREEAPHGPENYYVGHMESFDDLSEEAKPLVSAYYEKQGALYDLQGELERAWAAYQEDPMEFSPFLVSQYTSPAAYSDHIFYFNTYLTQTVAGKTVQDSILSAAFDRETGANIPLADLFVCPEEDMATKLLDLAEQGGRLPHDPTLKAHMEAAFRMEYLSVSQEYLHLEFPRGTLPGQEHAYLVYVDFTEDCEALLHPWAIPHPKP